MALSGTALVTVGAMTVRRLLYLQSINFDGLLPRIDGRLVPGKSRIVDLCEPGPEKLERKGPALADHPHINVLSRGGGGGNLDMRIIVEGGTKIWVVSAPTSRPAEENLMSSEPTSSLSPSVMIFFWADL